MANQEAYQQEMLGDERQRAAIRQTVGGALTGMVIVGLAFCLGYRCCSSRESTSEKDDM
jgi:hypothetical protein